MRAFVQNSENIEAHNKRSNETYERRLQAHSDLTFKEKKVFRMGVKSSNLQQETTPLNTTTPHSAAYGNFLMSFS